MPGFRHASDLHAIFVRLDRLTETMPPTWGRFTPARMLAHMSDSCRMALGELAVKPMTLPMFGPLSRDEWGVLGYRHLDHRLRQFGV